jgi:hypothetical protein
VMMRLDGQITHDHFALDSCHCFLLIKTNCVSRLSTQSSTWDGKVSY